MNRFDLFLLVVVGVFLIVGAWRGLVRLLLGIAGVVLGVFFALRFEAALAPAMQRWVVAEELLARLLAFVVIVVGVSVACFVVAWLVRQMLKVGHLAWLDRVLGATAGLLCALLFAGAIAVFLTAGYPDQSKVLAGSRTAPYLVQVSRALAAVAPADLKHKFDAGFQRLQKWLGEAKEAGARGAEALMPGR